MDALNGIEETAERYQKIVHAGIAKWVRDFQADKIKIETVEDLRKLIDMDMELQRNALLATRRRARAARRSPK